MIKSLQRVTALYLYLAFASWSNIALAQSEESSNLPSESGSEQAVIEESAEVTSGPSALDWLVNLSGATRSANFQISFVQNRAGFETIPYLWRHGVQEDGTEVEQLNLQNGPGRELIRVGQVVSVFEPDVAPYSFTASHISGPIPSELLYNSLRLADSYSFVLVGRSRVAGRSAQQVRIVSRDNSRFGYQVWLDEETGLLLKLNMLDLNGALLEQIQVTEITMLDGPHNYFARINTDALPEVTLMAARDQIPHGWTLDYLPVGMQEIRSDMRRLAASGSPVQYKLFSDGLVDVSVYVQPVTLGLGRDILLQQELNTLLSVVSGNAQITVIGQVPAKTAMAMANSIRQLEGG